MARSGSVLRWPRTTSMMDLVRRMGLWLSGNKRVTPAVAVVCALAVPAVCAAQAASATDRDARETLTRLADEAAAKGLPAAPLANKIQEGLAKGIDPKRIE